MAAKGSWIRIKSVDAHLNAKTVNEIVKTALRREVISVTQKPELRKAIGEEFVWAVTPFVPKKTGQLYKSGRATDDGRVYWSAVRPGTGEEGSYDFNYASITYDQDGTKWPNGEYNNPTTPETYPQWVKKVTEDPAQWEAFVLSITPLIKEAFKDE